MPTSSTPPTPAPLPVHSSGWDGPHSASCDGSSPPSTLPRGGRDRRQFARADIQLEIAYKTLEPFLQDYTRNISAGGLFIETRFPLEAGTRLTLRFALPGLSETLEVQGEVVRSLSPSRAAEHGSRPGMGVRFGALPEAARLRIDALVSECRDEENERLP